ncbi:hypothetical protein D9M71_801700 [compost metagenome]
MNFISFQRTVVDRLCNIFCHFAVQRQLVTQRQLDISAYAGGRGVRRRCFSLLIAATQSEQAGKGRDVSNLFHVSSRPWFVNVIEKSGF